MKIYKSLKLNINQKELLSFVGGGGKTTTIFELAKELIKENKKVLISTTTKIFEPTEKEYDYCFLGEIDAEFVPLSGTITVVGEDIKDGKLIGITSEKIDKMINRNIFDIILIEADGSKRKAIKAPADHEPIIPESTTKTIGVIGLDCLNKSIDEDTVHRVELFKNISGNENLKTINGQSIINLVLDKKGLFKNSRGEKILLLNKADESERISIGNHVKQKLKLKGFTNIVLGDVKKKRFY